MLLLIEYISVENILLNPISEFNLYGKILLKLILKNIPINIASGILLLLLTTSSDILTLINISMNKNSIETAPTYTSK